MVPPEAAAGPAPSHPRSRGRPASRFFGGSTLVVDVTVPEVKYRIELAQANGLAFSPDGVLCANDHGNWVMIGFSPAGEEVDRRPMMVPGYGYAWEAVIDDSGRVGRPGGTRSRASEGT